MRNFSKLLKESRGGIIVDKFTFEEKFDGELTITVDGKSTKIAPKDIQKIKRFFKSMK